MKILLIQPPSNIMYNRRESKPCLPPYGLVCIAGYLRTKGHEVKIWDCQVEGYYKERYFTYEEGKVIYWEERCLSDDFQYPENSIYVEYGDNEKWKQVVEDFNPDIVGVSCITSQRHFQACDLIKEIKRLFPKIITAIGGNHPSSLPELVKKECGESLDCLVVGEGENAFDEIISGKRGIINGTKVDIDNIGIPAHDLLNLDGYKKIWEETSYHFYNPVKFTIMNTSRGCANGCEHCPHEVVFGQGWRKRSLEKIEEEVKFVKSLGIEEIQFHEYNGFMSKTFMRQVASIMKRNNMRWNVPIGVWIKVLDRDYIQMLKKSGMNCIDLAIESPSREVLNTMPGKDVDTYHAEKVIEWCREAGLYINAFFMIGFPDQSLKDMWNTVAYAINLDLDTAVFFIAQPLPGTILWDKVKFIDDFHPFMLRYGKSNTKSDLWEPEEVEFVRYAGRKIFLDYKKRKGDIIRGGNFIERQ